MISALLLRNLVIWTPLALDLSMVFIFASILNAFYLLFAYDIIFICDYFKINT